MSRGSCFTRELWAEQYAILPSTLYLLEKVFSGNGIQRINGDMITFGDGHINLYIVKLYVFICGYIYTSILKSKIIEYSYKIRALHEMQISVILRKLFIFNLVKCIKITYIKFQKLILFFSMLYI